MVILYLSPKNSAGGAPVQTTGYFVYPVIEIERSVELSKAALPLALNPMEFFLQRFPIPKDIVVLVQHVTQQSTAAASVMEHHDIASATRSPKNRLRGRSQGARSACLQICKCAAHLTSTQEKLYYQRVTIDGRWARRQNCRRGSRRRLADRALVTGIEGRRRAYGVASSDARWPFARTCRAAG